MDTFTPIRQRLLAVLNVQPEAIVPVVAKKIVEASAWILPDMSINAIEEVVEDLRSVADLAEWFGCSDISADLNCIARELEAESVEPNGSKVGEVYIDFRDGEISGNCDGCSAADVADALMTVAEALRMMDETPDYIGFDEGKISVGQAGRNDHAS